MPAKINLKTKEELNKMVEGGKKLAAVKAALVKMIGPGVNAHEIEEEASRLIKSYGGKASFKMVPGYSWTSCVNVNSGVVHGIPQKVVFRKGDVVSVDVGFYYKGFHTDTSFSVGVDTGGRINTFLESGKNALKAAIKAAKVKNRIYDISQAIESSLKGSGLLPIEALVGHGIGRELHEKPHIPCFVSGKREQSPRIVENSTFAIEVMYTRGSPGVEVGSDGWTISTRDGKISGLFEETVAVMADGPVVLTEAT